MYQNYDHFFNTLEEILPSSKGLPRSSKKSKGTVINLACAFDIETTSFYLEPNNPKSKRALMYARVFGINGKCIRGRSIEEFIEVINKVAKKLRTSKRKKLIIYVHNLSFEFQFIRKYFKWKKVFLVAERKICYAELENGIQFRCSYILSNSSLYNIGENLLKYKVKKLVGDLDYSKIRNHLTPLSDKEWSYILNDGLVVMSYIQELIENNDGLINLPLTQTGRVRNYTKNYCYSPKYKNMYINLMRDLYIDEKVYFVLKSVFSGGFTHANHNSVGKTLKNIHSLDIKSSYPAVMISEKYPMTEFVKTYVYDMKNFRKLINNYACIFRLCVKNVISKIDYEHFLSTSKCLISRGEKLDNGRIISSQYIEIYMNEIDFKIFEECYDYEEIRIEDLYISRKSYLPKPIIECVLKFYKDKTTLKGVEGKEEEYMRGKEMLNSLFGMTVMDICRETIIYNDHDEYIKEEINIKEKIEKNNKSGARFLYYGRGCYITSYAKYNLWRAIHECKNDYHYSDTDSVKISNYENHISFFEKYNKEITEKVKACLHFHNLNYQIYKNNKGVLQLIGIWDNEGEYIYFKTLGAKRYMFFKDNKLSITISGVNKTKGVDYLLFEYKNIDNIFDNFKDNLVFPAYYLNGDTLKEGSGKSALTYIDEETSFEVIDYLGNKEEVNVKSSVHLEKVEYTLSLESLFYKYIFGVKLGEYKL